MGKHFNKKSDIELPLELIIEMEKTFHIESQTMVFITLKIGSLPQHLRLWNNTYLKCLDTNKKYYLLFSYNISLYPEWTKIDAYSNVQFQLYFENLPKSCHKFDLIEDIPEEGGFRLENIERNDSNIYKMTVF